MFKLSENNFFSKKSKKTDFFTLKLKRLINLPGNFFFLEIFSCVDRGDHNQQSYREIFSKFCFFSEKTTF
jgi:hypothetical protein